MARPSKLTPAQWSEVERRAAEGESHSALAREFKVGVSTVSARVSRISETVRNTAHKLADAQSALEALPVKQQLQAVSLADKLRNISNSLASAAELGAATSHLLHRMANDEARRLIQMPGLDVDCLKSVAAITRTANESSTIGLGLLNANKNRDDDPDAGPVEPVFNITTTE